MSGQIFAGRPSDLSQRRPSLLPKWVRRGLLPPTGPPAAADRKWRERSGAAADRPELEGLSRVSAWRRWPIEPGILFHLVCVGAVGAVIIAVCFGAGLYSLGHPADNLISNSSVDRPAGGTPPDGTPTGADVPPRIAASLGVLAAATPDSPQLGGKDSPGRQAPQLGLTAKAIGTPSELSPEPTQGGASPDPKQLKNASAGLVAGMVIEATDPMTWVVDGQVVHLWGIRPDLRDPNPSLRTFVDQVRAMGPVKCHRQRSSTRYQCFTATGEDIAKAALAAGVAQASDGATPAYREAEAEARRQGRGVWGKS
jgi:hypothetical protein